jgi:hypothetical protein
VVSAPGQRSPNVMAKALITTSSPVTLPVGKVKKALRYSTGQLRPGQPPLAVKDQRLT